MVRQIFKFVPVNLLLFIGMEALGFTLFEMVGYL